MSPDILIMAAGKGTRMKSSLPKVLHSVLGRPMIHHVLSLSTAVPHGRIVVVVGHGADEVMEACKKFPAEFCIQEQQLGTAHAVLAGKPLLGDRKGTTLILSGDVILLKQKTVESLLASHQESKALCTVVTAELADPHGYGRILREQGRVVGIREQKDCSPAEAEVKEVNSGIYCFDTKSLFEALEKVSSNNAQGEFYLTDVLALLAEGGGGVEGFILRDPMEMTGINDRYNLALVEATMKEERNKELMLKGVTIRNPESVNIDASSVIGEDVVIEGPAFITGSTIGSGTVLESGCRITGSKIGPNCHIKQGCYVTDSEMAGKCAVGPYAQLRPGTRLASGVKLGNFVEVKNASFGEGSKASHLSYIGDAEIGKGVNLGCGFVTCNYDGGPEKHKTTIEDNVFVGSDCQTVAPVTPGKGSYVASGSTITKNLPPDSLGIGRTRQTVKQGYAATLRKKKGIE